MFDALSVLEYVEVCDCRLTLTSVAALTSLFHIDCMNVDSSPSVTVVSATTNEQDKYTERNFQRKTKFIFYISFSFA